MDTFYDQLASLYHLIFQDWEASMQRQGQQLAALIESEWPGARTVLDVSCGIGTQAIPLARQGYEVRGSDLSAGAIARARKEARARGVEIAFSVCDMRAAHRHHNAAFDIVLSADNAVPHLLTDEEILQAFREMYACLKPGGGCMITVRDYEAEERGAHLVKPYGVHVEEGKRYVIFQVWDFDGDRYELTFFFIEEDLITKEVRTHVMRSTYYALSTARLCELMREAGFVEVRRVDGAFYQPVLLGSRSVF